MTAYIACDHTELYWRPTALTESRTTARRWATACLDQGGRQTHETCVIEYASYEAASADYLKGRISLAEMANKTQVEL